MLCGSFENFNRMLSSHVSLAMNAQVMVITRLPKYSQKKRSLRQQIQQNFLSNFNMVFVHGKQKEFYGTLSISAETTQRMRTNLKWMLVCTTVCLVKVMARSPAKAAASTRARALV